MNWAEEMAQRRKAAEQNECRELIEVESGSDWHIRKLQKHFPGYLWKYSEGQTVPGYVLAIAKQLEEEKHGCDKIPIDLYPCEYFRIMENSMPTDMFLQPKRLDKVKIQLTRKMDEYYNEHESELRISDDHLIPKIACAVRIDDNWYRGKLENAPTLGPWLYVNLVDIGKIRQVPKGDVRYLEVSFGHYPPLIIRATIRGAVTRRLDMAKIEKFRDLLEDLDYMARCQITSSSEPFEVNLCHPTNEFLNICDFLVTSPRGEPSSDGAWLPKNIARELERENGVDSRDDEDSGADSDLEDEDDDWEGWHFDQDDNYYVRSYPKTLKTHCLVNADFRVERVANEQMIYLTCDHQERKRNDVERCLARMSDDRLAPLPEIWIVFGTACVTRHQGSLKRAAIIGIQGSELDLALVDYGTTCKAHVSEVFSLPQENPTDDAPLISIVSLSAFRSVHFSRVEVLREILPQGTPVTFNRDRTSKSVPERGNLLLEDGTSVADLVLEQITAKKMNLDCFDLVPYHPAPPFLTEPVSKDFVYHCQSSVIYKKSKFVTSKF